MNRLLLFLMLSTHLYAQQTLELESFGHYNSTNVKRQIPDAFFYGGLIDSNLISASYAQLNDRNSFGLHMGAIATWKTPWALSKDAQKTSSSYQLMLSFGAEQYAGLQFSKGLFGLVFQGAMPFLGDTVQIGNLRAEATTFSKAGLGIYQPTSQSSLVLNFVTIHNQFTANLQNGWWYQDAQTAAVSLALQGSSSLTPSQPSFGFSLDLDYHFGSLANEQTEAQFRFRVQNLGLASMRPSKFYNLDGSLQYSGFTLAEWQQSDAQTLTQTFLDSLGFEQSMRQKWLLLPASISLVKEIDWESTAHLQAYYGAQFILR